MFIVFEWLDGSWSSTQANKLFEFLKWEWKQVIQTKEPTSDLLWKMVRDILQGKHVLSSDSLQLLFCADRAEHIASKIKPALEGWNIVISDRYYFSTIAFWSLGSDRTWLEKINENFIKPDIIFLFKLDPQECINRIEKRWEAKELFEKEKILQNVWKTYEYLEKKHDNCIFIDASRSIEEIFSEIRTYLWSKL